MGKIVLPKCECNVGFKEMYVGSGMLNYKEVCNVPTPCYNCGIVFLTNILTDEHNCPECLNPVKYFGEVVKIKKDDSKSVFTWHLQYPWKYMLANQKYRCPNCKEQKLIFVKTGMWD